MKIIQGFICTEIRVFSFSLLLFFFLALVHTYIPGVKATPENDKFPNDAKARLTSECVLITTAKAFEDLAHSCAGKPKKVEFQGCVSTQIVASSHRNFVV